MQNPQELKDWWDKFAIVAPVLATVIAALGAAAVTGLYSHLQSKRQEKSTQEQQRQDVLLREGQLRVSRVEMIERLLTRLIGTEPERRAAILAIEGLGEPELAARFAQLFASEGTVSALSDIASAKGLSAAPQAVSALAQIAKTGTSTGGAAGEALAALFKDYSQSLTTVSASDTSDAVGPEPVRRAAIVLDRRGKALTMSQFMVVANGNRLGHLWVRAVGPSAPHLTLIDYDEDSDSTRFKGLTVRNHLPEVSETVFAIGPRPSGSQVLVAGKVARVADEISVRFAAPVSDLPGSALLDVQGYVIGMRAVMATAGVDGNYVRADKLADFLRVHFPAGLLDRPAGLR